MPNGSCGKNLTWRLENNTLIISGNGKMDRYSTRDTRPAPWDKNSVEKIIIEHGVTTIGKATFKDCAKLKSITIPDSVTEIGREAFYRCKSLTEIKIPDSVIEIGDNAFDGCSSLKEIKIPDSVTEIGEDAFFGCNSLTEIKIPDGVIEIGEEAFHGCSSLKEIKIPDCVIEIGDNAFFGCKSLKEIKIPDSVTEIGAGAFCECNSLKEIKIPDGVTEIGASAFYRCKSLTEIKIPDGVTKIGYNAFCECKSLTEIKIPDGVIEIGEGAFWGCTSLKEITIPYGLKKLGDEVLDGCASLEKIYYRAGSDFEDILSEGNNATLIPVEKLNWKIEGITLTVGGVSEIKDYSTEKPLWNDYLNSIQKIIIEDGVKSISANAFSNCIHLEHLKIPSSLKTIGDFAFTFSFCGDRNINGGKNVFWSLDDGVLLIRKNPDSPPDSDFSVSDVSWKDIEQNICSVKVERGIIPNKNFFEWLAGLKNNIQVSF